MVLSVNLVLHYRIKHIELNLCFVREKVMWRKFDVCQAPSLDQTIDILTKAREKRMLYELSSKHHLSIEQENIIEN